jgi:tagaturonate reductase
MRNLPETVLQFGGGKFLRAFADLFLHQANEAGQGVGRVVVVQSTDSERARLLNAQGGRYHVAVQGLENGQIIDRVEEAASIGRALIAQTDWPRVLDIARSPELRFVLSNTTEAGYTLHEGDRLNDDPPRSFPLKLLRVLQARFESGLPGVTLLPCELFENNADRLRELLLEQAQRWDLSAALQDWLQNRCDWRNTLVDRIVTDKPVSHPLYPSDPLLTAAEPFAFWAVENARDATPPFTHPAILWTPDVKPYFLRKVRILNAAHTALVSQAVPRGMKTVREAVSDPDIRAWLERLLCEEILPTVADRVEAPEAFARQTLERFANPFLEHQLAHILVYHDEKRRVRLLPTRAEYVAQFGRTPPLLDAAIAWEPPGKEEG